MIEFMFAYAAIGMLFGIGVFQLLRRDLIKAAIGFAILFSAINLFFVAVGAFEGEFAPYVSNVEAGRSTSDPLVQALDTDGDRGQLRQFFAGSGLRQHYLAPI